MKILILFGHPAFQISNINKGLVKEISDIPNVTFHDLYEEYPEMDIDIDREQKLLSEHDCIIFQYPMYWYSTPAIFKEWQDLVLEHGWAFGSKGTALKGKLFFNVLSTGAGRTAYAKGEFQNYPLREFLIPFFQMATLCQMKSLPPFVTHGSLVATKEKIKNAQRQYHALLKLLANDELNIEDALKYEYLNDFLNKED